MFRLHTAAALVSLSAAIALALPAVSARAEEGAFSSPTIDLGLVVSDVAKSVKFYTDAVGFIELEGFSVPGAYAKEVGLTSTADATLDIRVLVLGKGAGATKLKLMQFKNAPKKNDNTSIDAELGFRYLTLHITDTTAAMERVKKAGVKPMGGPLGLPKGLPQDVYLTLLRDPDGNIVELVGPKK